ncbi:multicopper oxidase domain-containing protein [Alicyclobacillus cycloheptanicus]|uniref:Copper-containing nitrite reductase n=1 Tax=Alicyclobacillus cycloheptanicus TaxID=1457 RepID=A0ABT9XL83_9BACL|nr:multicopper oxidase domain-containing protein [Alicyclobacillus cycloheptanicus]MDQ0191063.1 nitrite reductase (NO-forming) [Alicyclobacillus cycloheptanicus]WDM00859.1 multicopper oxidase domain-containing protein [Alicyclobacillus cycloheptanicus]
MFRKSLRRMSKAGILGVAAVSLLVLAAGCNTPQNQVHSAALANGQDMSGNETRSSSSMGTLNQKPKPMTIVRHGNNVTINMYTEETMVTIAPGVQFPAWTFDGTVPGPVLYLQQGDHVTLTLHNLDPNMPHSIDLHAAQVAPNQDFTEVAPGKSKTITFDASIPGVFMYHCETEPMALHIAEGMYGAIIVTPKGQQPPTYTIVQSEFYQAMDLNAVLNDPPNYVVFNGEANRYVDHPLEAKVGQPLTVAFVNAGPNDFSAFHVVGTILRDVQASGNPNNHLYDVQTYTVAPGDGALIHLEFNAPGTYAFVSHSMSQMEKGAMGEFNVTG